MKIVLNVVGGPHEGQSFSFLEHDTFIVGRSDSAQFRLPFKDKALSRVHFLVEVNPPSCRLMDMASTNGTFVNGKRVTTIDLRDGDTIRAGKTHIEVDFLPDGALSKVEDVVIPATRVLGIHSRVFPGKESRTIDLFPREDDPVSPYPILPKLTIETELGRGGMGVVYRARTSDGEVVAVKTITPGAVGSEGITARFLREAAVLRTLEHPKIVRFREIGATGGLLYFLMDYVPGPDAELLVRRDSPLPIERALGIALQTLEALEFAHDRGFVHRDVKPQNLIVETQAGRDEVKLADFGLARVYLDSPLSGLSVTGQVAGTYGFMPPEQITNFRESRPAADLYAASATLYFLLTGQRIFDFPKGFDKQLLMILQDDPIPIQARRPEIPDALARVIHRSLNRNPKDRHASAKEMRRALSEFAVIGD